MSINKIIKLVYVILVLYGINGAKRISELECDKTSMFQVDERSLHPHMMHIVLRFTNIPICFATLISKHFLLSSEDCVSFIKVRSSKVGVRKSKLIGEEYPDRHFFTINSTISHEQNEIALIKLNEAVPYDLNTSIFQPACLWPEQIMPSTNVYSVYEAEFRNYEISNLRIKSGNIIIDEDCTEVLDRSDYYSNSYMCVNSSEQLNHFVIASPIGIKVGNRNYIVGVGSDALNINNYSILLGTKISSFISWIESHVWPNYPDQVPAFVCGQRKVMHIPAIAYGEPTHQNQFPWHVALFRFESGLQNIYKYICGGTIIDDQTILTAAHCVVDGRGVIPSYRLIIMAGTHNLDGYSNSTRTYSVNKITIHEEFNQDYMENDIALIKLNGLIEFSNYIQPVCIRHNLDFATNIMTIGTVVGWGKDEFYQPSNELRQGTFQIHNNSVCRKSDREFFHIYLNDGNYCAGYQNGTNVCPGDSGGAMIIQYKSRWYIRGIVSTAAAPLNMDGCNLNHTALFTNVTMFYNWILSNL